MYIRINQLKNLNPELKTMLAIGKAFITFKILHEISIFYKLNFKFISGGWKLENF